MITQYLCCGILSRIIAAMLSSKKERTSLSGPALSIMSVIHPGYLTFTQRWLPLLQMPSCPWEETPPKSDPSLLLGILFFFDYFPYLFHNILSTAIPTYYLKRLIILRPLPCLPPFLFSLKQQPKRSYPL